MNTIIIKFIIPTVARGEALEIKDRVEGLYLEAGETATLAPINGIQGIEITVPAIRASELCAELVREGFLD